MARTPSVRPRWASISRTTTSASAAPPQAALTMARSRRRRGRKRPGVSTKTSWAAPSSAMPRMRARVVWTLWVTIETLAPTMRLSSVDLPALGSPIRATKPQRVSASGRRRSSRVLGGRAARVRGKLAAGCALERAMSGVGCGSRPAGVLRARGRRRAHVSGVSRPAERARGGPRRRLAGRRAWRRRGRRRRGRRRGGPRRRRPARGPGLRGRGRHRRAGAGRGPGPIPAGAVLGSRATARALPMRSPQARRMRARAGSRPASR